jgi:hypothetical protein
MIQILDINFRLEWNWHFYTVIKSSKFTAEEIGVILKNLNDLLALFWTQARANICLREVWRWFVVMGSDKEREARQESFLRVLRLWYDRSSKAEVAVCRLDPCGSAQ